MAPLGHQRRLLLICSAVLVVLLFFIAMSIKQEDEEGYGWTSRELAEMEDGQRQIDMSASKDVKAEGKQFVRVREHGGECKGQVHLVIQFPILEGVNFKKAQKEVVRDRKLGVDARRRRKNQLAYANSLSLVHLERRQAEYAETLRRNVANPYVKNIHLLLEREEDREFVLSQGVYDPCGKLKFTLLGKYMTYHDAILYANENLKGEMSMIMNCDVFLGEGFGALTPDHFRIEDGPQAQAQAQAQAQGKAQAQAQGKDLIVRFKVYALSRYELASPFCVDKENEHCLKRANISSLDAFLFMSPMPFSAHAGELEIKQNTWGAENAILEVLRKKGGVIKNPCHLLQLGHLHCDGKLRPNQGTYQGKAKIAVSNLFGFVGPAYEL